jgi:hypothetical protein
VDDLEVDDQLAATIVDDKSADTATALVEGAADAAEEASLGNDRDALLDVAELGHGNEGGIVVEVQDAVGLVDRPKHRLDNNRRRRVGDEARLLLQLAAEEVDTQVAVLAGLGRHRDADHLARTTLEDQDVANADEVAGYRHGVGRGAAARLDNADILADAIADARGAALVDDHIIPVVVLEGVDDAVGGALNATAEGVVVAFVVVVAHLAARGVVVKNGVSPENSDVGARGRLDVQLATAVRGSAVVRDVGRLERRTTEGLSSRLGRTVVRDVNVDVVGRADAATVVLLSYVELASNALIVASRGFRLTGKVKMSDT